MEKMAFFSACMSENLSQARHVANGRMTFNSFFIALSAGVLALLPQLGSHGYFLVGALLCGVMVLLSGLTVLLVRRWNRMFTGFTVAAGRCYEQMRQAAQVEDLTLSPCAVPEKQKRARDIFTIFDLVILIVWLMLCVILLRRGLLGA